METMADLNTLIFNTQVMTHWLTGTFRNSTCEHVYNFHQTGLYLSFQAVVPLRRAHAVTVTGPGGALPPSFDGQLGPALLDAVVQQLGLWDRLVQVWNTNTESQHRPPSFHCWTSYKNPGGEYTAVATGTCRYIDVPHHRVAGEFTFD